MSSHSLRVLTIHKLFLLLFLFLKCPNLCASCSGISDKTNFEACKKSEGLMLRKAHEDFRKSQAEDEGISVRFPSPTGNLTGQKIPIEVLDAIQAFREKIKMHNACRAYAQTKSFTVSKMNGSEAFETVKKQRQSTPKHVLIDAVKALPSAIDFWLISTDYKTKGVSGLVRGDTHELVFLRLIPEG